MLWFCAGCCRQFAELEEEAEAKALCFALNIVKDWSLNIKTIFSNDDNIVKAVKRGNPLDAWRLNHEIYFILDHIAMDNLSMHIIPRSWNHAAHSLAMHGLNLHEISLFHHPSWILKSLWQNGFSV